MSDIESISDDSEHEAHQSRDADNIRDEREQPSVNEDEPENLEEFARAVAELNISDVSSETENQIDDASDETENQLDDGLDRNESPEDSVNDNSVRKELDDMVQEFKKFEILPDVAAELIVRKKLNTMNLDLYDYDKGFNISFQNYEEEIEYLHGRYSYGLSLIEYVRDGEIPYEIFDVIFNYKFQLFYEGFVLCRLRINFAQEESMRTHFVLLKHTIQTINAECAMRCKADSSLDFETEKARLICQYSPDLCLDPSPVVAEIVIANEFNQHPFITPSLKHIIQDEKARREMGVRERNRRNFPASCSEPEPTKPEDDDWSFRLNNPTEMEVKLSELASKIGRSPSILSYLKERRICFPDKDSFTGIHVEIENFVYEYDGCTRDENVESIQDKLCIGVLDDKESYYGAYKLDKRMKDYVDFYWWPIGNREALDLHVNAITKLEMKLSCSKMKITHNRMFDERVEVSDGDVRIVQLKLENPASQVILQYPLPSSEDEDEETDEENEC